MNQRVKRAQKKNNVPQITVASGGQLTRQQSPKDGVEVVVKQRSNLHTVLGRERVTGEVPENKEKESFQKKMAGLAKASPRFRRVNPSDLGSEDDQSKAIANNTEEDLRKKEKE